MTAEPTTTHSTPTTRRADSSSHTAAADASPTSTASSAADRAAETIKRLLSRPPQRAASAEEGRGVADPGSEARKTIRPVELTPARHPDRICENADPELEDVDDAGEEPEAIVAVTELDPLGQPVATAEAVSLEAAEHWDARLWRSGR